MGRIERYRTLCADGRTLDEQSTVIDIFQRRWKPSTIVRLEWECTGKSVEISHVYGLMAQLLDDASGVAILRASPRSRFSPELELIEPDGATRFALASPVRIDGRDVTGEFAWFESSGDKRHALRLVFWSNASDRYFLLDVDVLTGTIVATIALLMIARASRARDYTSIETDTRKKFLGHSIALNARGKKSSAYLPTGQPVLTWRQLRRINSPT